MVSFKSAVVVATAVSGAVAALSSAKCLFLTTVTDAAGVAALNACPTLSGDITVEGDGLGGAVDLSQVQVLKGNLDLTNSTSVTLISLGGLEEVDGQLNIAKFTSVFNIDFTKLSSVTGNLSLVTMPSLSGMNLNTGLTKLNSLTISDTALSELTGLVSNVTEMAYLDLDNNKNMSLIKLPLKKVTDQLILSFNDDNANVTLDSLEEAYSVVIQDVALVSLKKLKAVNLTFQIAYGFFEDLELPNLEEVDGSVRIVANTQLLNVSFPKLTTIGGELGFENNTKLEDLGDAFPEVTDIKGALNIKGDIGSFELPKLKQVAGTFTLESTNDELDCSKALDKSKVKANDPVCSAPAKKDTSSGSDSASATSTGKGGKQSGDSKSSDSSSSNNNSDNKKSGAAAIFPSLAAVIGAFLIMA